MNAFVDSVEYSAVDRVAIGQKYTSPQLAPLQCRPSAYMFAEANAADAGDTDVEPSVATVVVAVAAVVAIPLGFD